MRLRFSDRRKNIRQIAQSADKMVCFDAQVGIFFRVIIIRIILIEGISFCIDDDSRAIVGLARADQVARRTVTDIGALARVNAHPPGSLNE